MNQAQMIALLGRRDEPTDALRDYCRYLSGALEQHGMEFDCSEVRWDQNGWIRAGKRLWNESESWRGKWVLLQYTALSWSSRGIPLGLFVILTLLKMRGARVAIIFHDSNPFQGSRVVDKVRQRLQRSIMRLAYYCSERSFFSIALEKISWLPPAPRKARFIPIGANVPVHETLALATQRLTKYPNKTESPLTIAIFGVTVGPAFDWEFRQIVRAISHASERVPGIHLKVMGRGSDEARVALENALRNSNVTLSISGMLPDDQVARQLADSDVMLFARGSLTGSRGSALAGIACGLPLVAYAGKETSPPITEAGVELAPVDNTEALGEALVRVLTDDEHRQALRGRSRRAHSAYFSWDRIAERFRAELADA